MNSYQAKRYIKAGLFVFALVIGAVALKLSNELAKKLAIEERKKINTWAEATKLLPEAETEMELTILLKIVSDNTTIPAILVNEKGKPVAKVNIKFKKNLDSIQQLNDALAKLKIANEGIELQLGDSTKNYVYYGESSLLRQLRNYPYYAIGAVSLFILVSYFAFSYSRKSEQNRVWVGLAKETAHQLGTPISSLMAWIEYFDSEGVQLPPSVLDEMRKDTSRLQTITERFSKIGSEPVLKEADLRELLIHGLNYMKTRSPDKVEFKLDLGDQPVLMQLNEYLFEWVIENLIKNSLDAMKGIGAISVSLKTANNKITIDFSDTGSGIPSNKFKTVFKPGYTSKKRGWGLGLSLAKRIIENYHKGQIFVKESIPNTRTTFRMVFKKKSSI